MKTTMIATASAGKSMGFKPCKGCPTPAKCKAAGKCQGK